MFMSLWSTLKDLVMGPSIRKQFEELVLEEAVAEAEKSAAKAAPEPAKVEPQITDAVTAPAKPKRARTAKGKLKADDKSTPGVNEAWESGKAPAKKAKKAPAKKK